MSKSRIIRYVIAFALVFVALGALSGGLALASPTGNAPPVVSAPAQAGGTLNLTCTYPILRDISGETFEFTVELNYQGTAAKRFDLTATAPPKWTVTVLRQYEEKEAPAIELIPAKPIPDQVRVRLSPLAGENPNPGEYTTTLKVVSGDLQKTIDLKAIVTALYRFAFYTSSERLSAEVTAGQPNHVGLVVQNTGTDVIQKVTFTSSKPTGWTVTFKPDELTSVDPGTAKEIDMVIEPAGKTIAGDYMITLRAIPGNTAVSSRELELRVSVLAPSIWGWVGIAIVLVVIAGIGVIFRQLGRR